MLDPALPLQAAIAAALLADTDLAEIVGTRVYDIPPDRPKFPYVTLGDDLVVNDGTDCVSSAEVAITIHAWSQNKTYKEVKLMAARIAAVLDENTSSLSPEGHHLIDIQHETTRYLRDPDGVTRHAVITFQAITEAEAA